MKCYTPPMRGYDAHAHMQDHAFGPAPDAAWACARTAGLRGLVCNATHPCDWDAVASIAQRLRGVRPAYGWHPWRAHEPGPADWLDLLARRLMSDPAASVGECGLDHAPDRRDDAAQEPLFIAQLRLSMELRRPISLHARHGLPRLLELIEAHGPHPIGVIFHAFAGPAEMIPRAIRLQAFFSLAGSATFPNRRRARDVAAAVPEERLLVETDAPDIAWHGRPEGAPTGPADWVQILRALADLRGVPEERLAELAWANAVRVFGLPEGAEDPA
jgi:TatD DNase family protein